MQSTPEAGIFMDARFTSAETARVSAFMQAPVEGSAVQNSRSNNWTARNLGIIRQGGCASFPSNGLSASMVHCLTPSPGEGARLLPTNLNWPGSVYLTIYLHRQPHGIYSSLTASIEIVSYRSGGLLFLGRIGNAIS